MSTLLASWKFAPPPVMVQDVEEVIVNHVARAVAVEAGGIDNVVR